MKTKVLNIDNLTSANFLKTEGLQKGALVVYTSCSCHKEVSHGGYSFSPQYIKPIAKIISDEAKRYSVERVIMSGGCLFYEPEFCIASFKRALAELKIDSVWLDYGKIDLPGYEQASTIVAINNILFAGKQTFNLDLSADWGKIKLQEAACSHFLRSVKKKLQISKQIEEEKRLLARFPFVFPVTEVSRDNSLEKRQIFGVGETEISPSKFTALFANDWKSGVLLGKTQNFYFILEQDEEQINRKISDLLSFKPKKIIDFPIVVENISAAIWIKINSGKFMVENHPDLDFSTNPDEHFTPLHMRITS